MCCEFQMEKFIQVWNEMVSKQKKWNDRMKNKSFIKTTNNAIRKLHT